MDVIGEPKGGPFVQMKITVIVFPLSIFSQINLLFPMSRSRNYCYTLNNYVQDDVERLLHAYDDQKDVKYHVVGNETGDSGTPHIQGFIQFNDSKTFSAAKGWFTRVLSHTRTHLEPMRGTPFQATEYCKKEGDWQEFGIAPVAVASPVRKMPASERYARNMKLVNEHKYNELSELDPVWFMQNCSKFNLVNQLLRSVPAPLTKPVGFWISGAAGVGKSTFARRLVAKHGWDIYDKMHNKWWDGYRDQPAVIWDEFGRNHADIFTDLLKRWTDEHTVRVEFKGGSMVIRPKCFIITSNYSLEEVFGGLSPVDRAAVERRFRYIIQDFERSKIDQYLEYKFD